MLPKHFLPFQSLGPNKKRRRVSNESYPLRLDELTSSWEKLVENLRNEQIKNTHLTERIRQQKRFIELQSQHNTQLNHQIDQQKYHLGLLVKLGPRVTSLKKKVCTLQQKTLQLEEKLTLTQRELRLSRLRQSNLFNESYPSSFFSSF